MHARCLFLILYQICVITLCVSNIHLYDTFYEVSTLFKLYLIGSNYTCLWFPNAIIRRANFCKKYNTQLIYYSFQRGISLRVLRTCTIKIYSSKVDICNVEKFRFKILEAIKLFNQPKIGILRGVSTKWYSNFSLYDISLKRCHQCNTSVF